MFGISPWFGGFSQFGGSPFFPGVFPGSPFFPSPFFPSRRRFAFNSGFFPGPFGVNPSYYPYLVANGWGGRGWGGGCCC
jgi:hypothetical protein